ncbi:unnamed protein product [Effrenium voratum]|nr:unnamed protein product [Effrenium voratum]
MFSLWALVAVGGDSLVGGQTSQTGGTGKYPSKYNLIDPDPSCRYNSTVWPDKGPQCPIYKGPGDEDVMAVHPNTVERTLYLMRNMARLFPTHYASSAWGWTSGAFKDDCHQSHSPGPERPYYFMSEAVQAARLNAFSGATAYSNCTRSTCGTTSHYTCCDYCMHNIWGQCGFKYRTRGIVQPLFVKNAWNDVGGEGIWGQNTAFTSSAAHCGQNFNPAYDHQGIGYYPGGATTMVGIKDTNDWEDHVFPHATHFDWQDDVFTFLVQWFGRKQERSAAQVFLLYAGQARDLGSPIVGDGFSGFYMQELPLTSATVRCEPYAFIARDQKGNWHRLPEEESYYFGTVSQPQNLVDGDARCGENHYYYTGSQWVANGGPGLSNAKTSATGCVGCGKVSSLHDMWLHKKSGLGEMTISVSLRGCSVSLLAAGLCVVLIGT